MTRPSCLPLLALLAAPAFAGAPPRVVIPEGTRLRVFDVGPKDAFYAQRASLNDLECTVGPGPLKPVKSTWFKGRVSCDDGRDYVFWRFTFESLSLLAPSAEGCPTASWIGGNVPEGSRVRFLAASENDGYFGYGELAGRVGTVAYGEMYPTRGPKGCWLSGTVLMDDPSGYPSEYYFYEAAVAVESKGTGAVYSGPTGYGGEGGYYPTYVEPTCVPEAFTGATLTGGTRVSLLDIHPEDAYYDARFDYLGKTGVIDGEMHNNSDSCWFGGSFIADDGTSFYFYKASVQVLEAVEPPTCADGVATSATIPKGNRIKIVDVHPEDAYFATRFSVIGSTGTTSEQLELMDSCWYAGPMHSDEGDDWYFFKASVVDLGTPQ